MAAGNFQDIVVLSSNTLKAGIEQLVVGSSAGSKSIVFAQDVALVSAMHLVASNPTAQRTAILPDANGTLGYLTNFSAGAAAITAGAIVFSNQAVVFGINASTITAGLNTVSYWEIGVNDASISDSRGGSSAITTSVHTYTASGGIVSGQRLFISAPMNVTYIDPRGQAQLKLSMSQNSGSWTGSASITMWCALYTFTGSTAQVVSSASQSTSMTVSNTMTASSSQSTNVDMRFTNITWNVTPGEYIFVTGHSMSESHSFTGNTSRVSAGGSFLLTGAGVALAEVSYSIPTWGSGSINASATSYHLSQLSNSGGTNSTTAAPYIVLAGS